MIVSALIAVAVALFFFASFAAVVVGHQLKVMRISEQGPMRERGIEPTSIWFVRWS